MLVLGNHAIGAQFPHSFWKHPPVPSGTEETDRTTAGGWNPCNGA